MERDGISNVIIQTIAAESTELDSYMLNVQILTDLLTARNFVETTLFQSASQHSVDPVTDFFVELGSLLSKGSNLGTFIMVF